MVSNYHLLLPVLFILHNDKNILTLKISFQFFFKDFTLKCIDCYFSCQDGDSMFYPAKMEHENTFSYLVVDPIKRTATVFYHNFGASEFE